MTITTAYASTDGTIIIREGITTHTIRQDGTSQLETDWHLPDGHHQTHSPRPASGGRRPHPQGWGPVLCICIYQDVSIAIGYT